MELPSRCIFFDCETKQRRIEDGAPVKLWNRYGSVEANFWFGYGAFTRRYGGFRWTDPEWLHFEEPFRFWDWVLENTPDGTKMYVFAHNAGFDASVSGMFDYFYKVSETRDEKLLTWHVDSAILDDPPTGVTFVLKGEDNQVVKTVIVLDTLNWFRVPLAVLGRSIGLEKLDMPKYSDPYEDWKVYCRRDVEVTLGAMQSFMKFVHDQDLGNFARTLPGQALASYKHRFKYDQGIYIDSNEKALNLSREAYHGGRVEIFFQGHVEQEMTCVDINSMYPYVMSDKPFPMRFVTHVKRMTKAELAKAIKQYAAVARVKILTDEAVYCYQYQGKLVFPIGSFTVTLCTPEIELALERGHITEVEEVALYEQAPIFADYVNFFWELRKEAKAQGDTARDVMSKLFMNSLYGKFGQTGRVFDEVKQIESGEVKRWSEWDADEERNRTFRMIYGLIQEERSEGEALDSLPAISAHVTAYGRVMLWNLIRTAGTEHVYYCDTDSLFVDSVGLNKLSSHMDDSKLGSLKVEWKTEALVLRGNKDYSTGKYTKIKGIRKDAMKLIWNGVGCGIPSETYRRDHDHQQERLIDLQGQLEEHKALVRPKWAAGISNIALKDMAAHEGLNPYQMDWGHAMDPVLIKETRATGLKGNNTIEINREIRGIKKQLSEPKNNGCCCHTWIDTGSFNFNVYVQERFHGLVSKIRAGDMNTQIISMTKKIYKRTYTKGRVMPGGKVLPLEFRDDVLVN